MIGKALSQKILHEIKFQTSRSSGPGGQHVNKVESKVTLKWCIGESKSFSETQKNIIRIACKTRINKDDELIISSEGFRSQVRNKEITLKKLDRLLAKAFLKKKPRIPTKPGKAAVKKRLDEKRRNSEKKNFRKRVI